MPALDVLTSYGDICCWIEFVIGWNSPLSVVLGHVTAKPIFSHTVDIEEVNLWSSCQQSASVDSYHLKPMWLLYLRAKCGSNHQCIFVSQRHFGLLVALIQWRCFCCVPYWCWFADQSDIWQDTEKQNVSADSRTEAESGPVWQKCKYKA